MLNLPCRKVTPFLLLELDERVREALVEAIDRLAPSQRQRVEERLAEGGDRPKTWQGADDVAYTKAKAKLRTDKSLREAYADCA